MWSRHHPADRGAWPWVLPLCAVLACNTVLGVEERPASSGPEVTTNCQLLCETLVVNQCGQLDECVQNCRLGVKIAPLADCVPATQAYFDCESKDPCASSCNPAEDAYLNCIDTYCSDHPDTCAPGG